MALVTVQVIEGLERGTVYRELPTPVCIGREDDNDIRLNDERVSRFHAKIQEYSGAIILTDLDSTNGTRVNGHPVQMRVLQVGDQLTIGRCLLIYGSDDEIAARAEELRNNPSAVIANDDRTIEELESEIGDTYGVNIEEMVDSESVRSSDDSPPFPMQPFHTHVDHLQEELFPSGPPTPPTDLAPLQRAQLSDFLAYIHEQVRVIMQSAVENRDSAELEEGVERNEGSRHMKVDWFSWQRLLKVEMNLAVYLRNLAEPDE